MKKTILVIDDELDRTSILGLELRKLLEPKGFTVEFCQNGEDGIKQIKADKENQIKVVLLDIEFKKGMQGLSIFKAIKDVRLSLPIVMLTKIPVRNKEFKVFSDLGANLYMEKRDLKERGQEQANFIETLANGIKLGEYTLLHKMGIDHKNTEFLEIDIVDKNECSILKNPKRIKNLDNYVLLCIKRKGQYVSLDDDPTLTGKQTKKEKKMIQLEECLLNSVKKMNKYTLPEDDPKLNRAIQDFMEFYQKRHIKEGMTVTEFHKTILKLNIAIKISSGGRIPQLLISAHRKQLKSYKLSLTKVKEKK